MKNVVYIRSHCRMEARINCSMWFSHNQSAGKGSFHSAQKRCSSPPVGGPWGGWIRLEKAKVGEYRNALEQVQEVPIGKVEKALC
jgi:hypothetical protein